MKGKLVVMTEEKKEVTKEREDLKEEFVRVKDEVSKENENLKLKFEKVTEEKKTVVEASRELERKVEELRVKMEEQDRQAIERRKGLEENARREVEELKEKDLRSNWEIDQLRENLRVLGEEKEKLTKQLGKICQT